MDKLIEDFEVRNSALVRDILDFEGKYKEKHRDVFIENRPLAQKKLATATKHRFGKKISSTVGQLCKLTYRG